jgi:hypothetical protein
VKGDCFPYNTRLRNNVSRDFLFTPSRYCAKPVAAVPSRLEGNTSYLASNLATKFPGFTHQAFTTIMRAATTELFGRLTKVDRTRSS